MKQIVQFLSFAAFLLAIQTLSSQHKNSPLMIGCNMKNIRPSTLEILKNTEVITINQDTLGIQAQLVLYNAGNISQAIRVNFSNIQLAGNVQVRNLWLHKDEGTYTGYYETVVPVHGTIILRLEGETTTVKLRHQAEDTYLNNFNAISLTSSMARPEKVSGVVASGGYKVSYLGNNADNWAEFRNVHVPSGGVYSLKIYYYSSGSKDLFISVNGTEYEMPGLNSGRPYRTRRSLYRHNAQ